MTTAYQCPLCQSESLVSSDEGLHCADNHFFPYLEGTKAPLFSSADANVNEYTTAQAAEIHDNSLRWLFSSFGGDEESLRESLISRLHLSHGKIVLITGVGAGNDLPFLAKRLGNEGVIYAQDFSCQMLISAIDRSKHQYGLADYNIEFSASDATNLPFRDGYFDAVYHFGGLNLFSDIGKGISEMDRVVKDGGRIVFGDEGLAPWLKDTEYGKMIINNNPLCDFEAPLNLLSPTARDVNLSWEVGYCFYVIEYTASKNPLTLNADVLHLGRRGGTMRTRYFGKLEGVDPELKVSLYEEAERRGISRVELIESLLRKGLQA